jgi:hypothetical protein
MAEKGGVGAGVGAVVSGCVVSEWVGGKWVGGGGW